MSDLEIFLQRFYFLLKPILPKWVQIYLRRNYISMRRPFYENIWPIDEKAKVPPPGWIGWPEGKRFALVLTHDIETEDGQEKCVRLASLEENLGFKSSFNFIAKQYEVSSNIQSYLKDRGLEVGLHGLHHDGNLFRTRKIFLEQAAEINKYLREWGAIGFRCPSMYHNLEWIGELDIQYDSSTFDTDPFEPQPDGVGTIFPFWVKERRGKKRYLELPYTLPQDHTLFLVMQEKSIDIWKKKLDWIAANEGMALLITHPDYMDFDGKGSNFGSYPIKLYEEFLAYIKSKYAGEYWGVLPRDLVQFFEQFNSEIPR